MVEKEIFSNITGTVLEIEKNVGDKVTKGEVILIIESMKMEMEIEAPYDGILKQILVKKDELVQDGQPVAILETEE